jgi:anti-sigma B factor antagonist
MSLTIQREDREPATSVITLRGRLLLGPGCKELERLVPELLDQGRRTLIFDLNGVTHIDSTGIGRFIDAYGRLQKLGGSLRLACAGGAVRDVFRVTRLDTVLSFYPTVAEAVAANQ